MNWFKKWVKIGQALDGTLTPAELDATLAELDRVLKTSGHPVDVRIETFIDEPLDAEDDHESISICADS